MRMTDDLKVVIRRKLSFWQTIRAVLWAFFGVRKHGEYEKDTEQLNPLHIIAAGLIGAVLFIAALLLIVRAVVS